LRTASRTATSLQQSNAPLQADVLIVECEQQVFTAMIAFKEGHGSFADALIAALGTRAGCSHTITFDRKALRLPGFALP
jgi:predicted nucleic-acid-binding protein